MRGHEHQREGHKSSRSGSWEGFEKLKKALEGLATAKGVSQSRISAVAKLAAHYSKFYKHVVHDIEVFVWKAEVEHRLAGLYAIDAIIRQSHAKHDAKDAYIKRFLIRLADTIEAVKHVPDEYQPKVRHVIDEWQKRGIYSAKQIEEAGGQDYLSPGQDENVTPRASPGKLASLLSIIKQKKEEQEHFDGHQQGLSPYKQLHDVDRRQTEETGASYTHQSYDEHRSHSHYTNRREVGGIMGDAPGVPVGSGRIRRAPDDQPGDINDRDAKKARESRWGPPRMDNLASMDRSAPHETSSDREGEAHATSGRSGYGAQAPLLPSSHSTPQRHEEWTGTAPSRAGNAGWPPSDEARPPQAGTLGRHNTFPYEPSGGAGPRVPFPGAEDRRSPVHRIPGTSGEICRNFLAGRCTFGDRCWHIHDPHNSHAGGAPRPDIIDSKRKTVLCNNYPLGKCRFGDKCSFAHGEEELEKSAKAGAPRHAMPADQAGSRWQAPSSSRLGLTQPPPSSYMPPTGAAAAPGAHARMYGGAQGVYNEPHGEPRGLGEGAASSVSFANATAPPPGGRRLPPDQEPTPQVYAAGAFAHNATLLTPPVPSYGSTCTPAQGHVSAVPPVVPPPPPCASQSRGGATTGPVPTPKVAQDDDDGDTVEPEFTLEYDDDD